jgi:uncharacterized protein (TIGR03435 family)
VLGGALSLVPDGQHLCSRMVSPRGNVDIEGGTLLELTDLLGMVLDRPVIDKIGITPVTAEPGASAAVGSADAPGVFQAIQEQLSLRLVPDRGTVDVLVIDHIEGPSAN